MVSHHALSFKLYENSNQAPSQARIFRLSKNKGLLVSSSRPRQRLSNHQETKNYWFHGESTALGKTNKVVCGCKSIYRSTDAKKWWDYKPTDSEDASKMWDCCEFVHHMEILPTAGLDSAADRLLSVHPRSHNIRRSHISSLVFLWYM